MRRVSWNLNQQLSFYREEEKPLLKGFFSVSKKYSIILELVQLILWILKLILSQKKFITQNSSRLTKTIQFSKILIKQQIYSGVEQSGSS